MTHEPSTREKPARAARNQRTGARAVAASESARKAGALILEALAGLRSTQQAADALGVALPRYYVLETRALAGLVAALEPRSRGRQRGAAQRIDELEAEVQRLERETRRYQALQRASHRALGVSAASGAATTKKATARSRKVGASDLDAKAKRKRRPNRAARAERLARELVAGSDRARGDGPRSDGTRPAQVNQNGGMA